MGTILYFMLNTVIQWKQSVIPRCIGKKDGARNWYNLNLQNLIESLVIMKTLKY